MNEKMCIFVVFAEDAQGKGNCPRKNGSFAHPDPTICDIFYNCENGNANEVKCTGGLHFNEYTGNCEWPNSAGREGCATAAQKSNVNQTGFCNQFQQFCGLTSFPCCFIIVFFFFLFAQRI